MNKPIRKQIAEYDIQEEVRALDLGSKVRQLRLKRNLTLQHVSDMTGLSKPLLSQIENNNASPPIATLLKIAKAFSVGISYFFQNVDTSGRIAVVRRKDRQTPLRRRSHHPNSNVGYHYESLAYPMVDKHMEPFMVEIESCREDEMRFYHHQGEEFLYILQGLVEFRGGKRILQLEEGDSLYFESNIPHAMRSLITQPSKALAVVYAP